MRILHKDVAICSQRSLTLGMGTPSLEVNSASKIALNNVGFDAVKLVRRGLWQGCFFGVQ